MPGWLLFSGEAAVSAHLGGLLLCAKSNTPVGCALTADDEFAAAQS
jgi:hypothetical protein